LNALKDKAREDPYAVIEPGVVYTPELISMAGKLPISSSTYRLWHAAPTYEIVKVQ
jgi:hypothetical protein